MIGEIRDLETAHVAVQIALAGHLVLTQLHAAAAPGAPKRLLDMGVEPFLVNQSVVGVISQRLVRRLCTACRRPVQPDLTLLPPEARALLADSSQTFFFGPGGCEACRGTGFRGRLTIQGILLPDDGVRTALVQGDIEAIRATARKAGMHTLLEDGMLRAAEGMTSVDEVLRVALTPPHQ